MAQPYRNSIWAASICYGISVIFLIIVIIGTTSSKAGIRDIYFFKVELANIIPLDAPNAVLLNSVARSLGLHDFYQIGLWNFCEGYNDEGIVFCSKPQRFYWFNPVEVLMNELLAGAKIALPTQVLTILTLLRVGQQTIFGLFVTGLVFNLLLTPMSLMALRSWKWSFPLVFFAFLTGLFLNAATIVATIFSVAAKYALTLQSELNISVHVSGAMLSAMWVASVLSSVAFFLHCAVGCCCRRQRKTHLDERAVRKEAEKEKRVTQGKSPEKKWKRLSHTLPDMVRKRKHGKASEGTDGVSQAPMIA